jgi:hypothetical protein
MKKIFAAMSLMAFAVTGVIVSPSTSEAVPVFARQMNLPCMSCHFQNVPKLNAFGRAFKLGAYTDTATDLIEDDNVSIPATMPLGFVYKFRYQLATPTNSHGEKKGTDRGEWQIPDEAAIWMGGRGGANLGYKIEWGGPYLGGAIIWSLPVAGGRLGAYVQSTDALGWENGMEIFNTGTLRSNRMLEQRGESNAFHALGVVGGGAQGLGVYYGSGMFFANVSLYAPVFEHADGAFDLSLGYRLAVTPTVAGWDTMVGIIGSAGSTKCVECAEIGPNEGETLQEFKTEWMGVDAQAQGQIAGMDTEIVFGYANVGNTAGNIYGEGNALSLGAEVSFSPMINLAVAYMAKTDKSSGSDVNSSAFTVAPIINITQNQNIRLEYTSWSGDGKPRDAMMTLMLFGGF